MDKASGSGMRLHQALSFCRPMMRLSPGRAVFWPGCALMTLDPSVLQRTLAVLRREEEMGLSSCCCGQPTRYLMPDAFPARRDMLAERLRQSGVERIYAACPNCLLQLKELGTVQVYPIWSVLARHLAPEDLASPGGSFVLHDPCPMRREAEEQEAVRTLLSRAGVEVTEPAHTQAGTICCGNYHMMRTTDPEKSAAVRRRRLEEFPDRLPVTSYCQGCLDAFQSEGRSTAHILELLFGVSRSRGWKNRLRFTAGVPTAVAGR